MHPYRMGALLGAALSLLVTAPARAAEPPPDAPAEAAPPAPRLPARAALPPAPPPPTSPWWAMAPAPAPPPRTDPLKTMGITLTALGAAGLLGSSIMVATSKDQPAPCDPCSSNVCNAPVFGCNPGPIPSDQRIVGSALLGASLITTLIGAPLWALGSIEESPELGLRSSDTTLLVGIGLTTLGAAATAGGAFAGLAGGRRNAQLPAVVAGIVGTTSMLVGIPIWASGTKRKPPPSDAGIPLVRRSRSLMLAGISLSIVGATFMGGGAIVGGFSNGEGGARALSAGLTFGGLGVLLAGIPMWYVGQEKVPSDAWSPSDPASAPTAYAVPPSSEPRDAPAEERRRPPPRASIQPSLQVGPTSVALRFSF
jgi:hypothetical protein